MGRVPTDGGSGGGPGSRGEAREEVSRPRVSHRLEYLLVQGVGGVIRVLPEAVATALGGALGWVVGTVVRVRRRVVDRNLAVAFPERSAAWRSRVARRCYLHLGREGVNLVRLAWSDPVYVRERTEVEGMEEVRGALERGKGLLVLTGHLGNWEVGGAALACRGTPLDAVAVRQRNPLFDQKVMETRRGLGMEVVEKKRAPTQVLRSLRRGRAVALVADQNVRNGGVFVDFFGTPAATARGPALFAFRTGAPVVVGTALRLPGLRARYRIRIRPLPVTRTGDMEADVARFTRAYLEVLEEEIRNAPEQYFWHHRRWKTRPPAPLSDAGCGAKG